jgi:hypothetical protein
MTTLHRFVAATTAAIFILATMAPAAAESKRRRKKKEKDPPPPTEMVVPASPAPAPAPAPAAAPPAPTPPASPPGKGQVTDEDLAKAKAGQTGTSSDARPWARGVTKANQDKAIALFEEANQHLRDSVFKLAAQRYREALKYWNHPAIHYNLALAMVNLDQPIEMHAALQQAIGYGPAPLEEDKFQRAKEYIKLVEAQLAAVDIACDSPGAEVLLDGQVLFTAPGSHKGLVRIGEHTVVARKQGYVATTLTQKLGSGETMRLNLKLFTDEELTRYQRPFSPIIPYSVLGGGVLFVALGAIFHVQAKSGFSDFDDAITECGGCVPTPEVLDKRSSAESKQTLAFVMYAVGALALAGGGVLLYVSRPKPYRIDPLADQGGGVSIIPVLTPDSAGFSASFRF